jgi:DNA-3-methyladenine glycosylase II
LGFIFRSYFLLSAHTSEANWRSNLFCFGNPPLEGLGEAAKKDAASIRAKLHVMQQAFEHLINLDHRFADIIALYGTPNIPRRPEGFESLCKIIFEQQVSLDSAKACFDKLNALLPEFTPENILLCSDEQLRSCGLSRQKSSYIRALSEAIVSGSLNLSTLSEKSAYEVRAELIKIKGIGNWTIDVYLMFCLQSPDVIPLGDIGIIITIKELWNIQTPDEIAVLTNTWAPYRTAASFFLWHYYLKKRNRVIHM